MAWTKPGGQAILTLRSLIQNNRWRPAWALLSADFRQTVRVSNRPNQLPALREIRELSDFEKLSRSGLLLHRQGQVSA